MDPKIFERIIMFNGMEDAAWELIKSTLTTSEKRSRGMPHADFRLVLNSILWITITGARWADLPRGGSFASKSSSHRWLLRWQRDGTWQKILEKLLRIAAYKGLIDLERLLVDGAFSPCKVGRRGSSSWLQGKRDNYTLDNRR
jgi:transposase